MSVIKFFRPIAKQKIMRGERVDWIENNARRDYIRRVVLSFPPWVDRKELQALWEKCRWMEKIKGERYVLDHMVPISHPYVSGLSVPWNFQVIPYRCNAAKSNRWCPDQYTIEFPEMMPEQLELIK